MKEYTKIDEINVLLNEVEDYFTDIVGRFQAQKMIAIFSECFDIKALVKGSKEIRNIWEEVYNLGKKHGETQNGK